MKVHSFDALLFKIKTERQKFHHREHTNIGFSLSYSEEFSFSHSINVRTKMRSFLHAPKMKPNVETERRIPIAGLVNFEQETEIMVSAV